MKNIFTIIVMFAAITFNAQTDKEYFDLIKKTAKVEAKQYVYTGLNLNNAELIAFDSVFDQYLKEEGRIMLSKIALFDAYANNASTYSDEQINNLNKNVFKYDLQRSKLNKKYYPKFVKAIGVDKATTFFFLKKYLDNQVEMAKLEFLAH